MHTRFSFRFFNASTYRGADVVILGTHHEEAKVAAWIVLADQEKDQAVRASWRLVSTVQQPLSEWLKAHAEVAS